MAALERIADSPLFRPLDDGEAAMIEGGQEIVVTGGVNPDGTVWRDHIVQPANGTTA